MHFSTIRILVANLSVLACICTGLLAEIVEVRILPGIEKSVGGVSEFDRSKFMVLHSNLGGNDWTDEDEALDYLMEDLDLYMGRDNGSITWQYNQSRQDPLRPGYVDPAYVVEKGSDWRLVRWAQDNAHHHKYDDRLDLMIGGLPEPFWPGSETNPFTGTGWAPTTAEGTGEYMGRFLQEFYRNPDEDVTLGPKRPRFIEVMNEPLYHFLDDAEQAHLGVTALEVFEFHNTVAAEIRKFDPEVMIGGFTVAFPYFDERDFARWHERDKLFMDVAGENMDFISLHFYDFHKHHTNGGSQFIGPWNFKGGRVEATLDMVEQYSMLSWSHVKPMLISEYGGRDHGEEWKAWTPERDWSFMKSFTPMIMSFMDRPDRILKAIPFVLIKATWDNGPNPYPWRMMRQQKEAEGETGEDWVFTEMIKFYELWSDVKGRRGYVDTNHPDVKSDVYVDGEKVYLILSNLDREELLMDLTIEGIEGNELQSIRLKHLYAVNDFPVLDEEQLPLDDPSFTLGEEASAIMEYVFSNPIQANGSVEEATFYSSDYLWPIVAGENIPVNINDVETGNIGSAVLRIGAGRDHGRSLHPFVTVNGTALRIDDNLQGDDQSVRANFFGLIEVPVPIHLLKENNDISIKFPDNGGHVSTVTLRVSSSTLPLRKQESSVEVTAFPAGAGDIEIQFSNGVAGGNYLLLYTDQIDQQLGDWEVLEEPLHMDEAGMGAVSEALTNKSRYYAVVECPECLPPPAPPSSIIINCPDSPVLAGHSFSLTVQIEPENVTDDSLAWSSSNPEVASVDQEGMVTAHNPGSSIIRATTVAGGLYDECLVEVEAALTAPGVVLDDDNIYLGSTYQVGGEIAVNCRYFAGEGHTVTSRFGGLRFFFRQIAPGWSVIHDVPTVDYTAAVGTESGIASATLSLDGIQPSDELPDGHFYFLFVNFESTNGNTYNKGLYPITVEAGD